MKISEILWKAANEHLWTGHGLMEQAYGYSCSAAAASEGVIPWLPGLNKSDAVKFMRSLGCKPNSDGCFNSFECGPRRQGARYAWLMFASMYAEELGL